MVLAVIPGPAAAEEALVYFPQVPVEEAVEEAVEKEVVAGAVQKEAVAVDLSENVCMTRGEDRNKCYSMVLEGSVGVMVVGGLMVAAVG